MANYLIREEKRRIGTLVEHERQRSIQAITKSNRHGIPFVLFK